MTINTIADDFSLKKNVNYTTLYEWALRWLSENVLVDDTRRGTSFVNISVHHLFNWDLLKTSRYDLRIEIEMVTMNLEYFQYNNCVVLAKP